MTLMLNLPPEFEQRLTREAKRLGVSAQEYALNLLDQGLPRKDRRDEIKALVVSWVQDGDAQEQRETGEYLIRVLDEDRLSDRKLYPPELKGVSW